MRRATPGGAARDYALRELDRRELPNWPTAVARRTPAGRPTDPRDAALGEQIAGGVVRHLLLLQERTAHYANRPYRQVHPLVAKVLAIGLYQIRLLDRVPPSAAVNEAVEQTRRFGQPRASGFVNAVLRKATLDPPGLPPANTPADVAERHLSCPRPLFERFSRHFGDDEALLIARHALIEPPILFRLAAGASAADLTGEGVTVSPHESRDTVVIKGAGRADYARWADAGLGQVQDATSAETVPMLNLRPGERVLDRCCGVGTKTVQMWEIVGATGRILAIDPAEDRIRTLRETLDRRGIGSVQTLRAAAIPDGAAADGFDAALIDAPCSNSGVLARRPEAKYRVEENAASSNLAGTQRRVLRDALAALRPGGRAVYSTCSVWPEENEAVVRAVLESSPRDRPTYRLVRERTTLPQGENDAPRYRDGGYAAEIVCVGA